MTQGFFLYMEELRLYKLGIEKQKTFEDKFDELSLKYEKKARDAGYDGKIKYIIERGKVLIYVIL